MRIGVPKEIKDKENRVAMTPEGVTRLVALGHEVFIEREAGTGSGFLDNEYRHAGAQMVSVAAAWDKELVVKVKEPLSAEYSYLSEQMVFTFFHLSGVDKRLTIELLERRTTAIAYETLEDEQGRLPILAPMSAVAGNMASLMGSYYLASFNHGKGIQLAEVLGKNTGKVLVIGDGVVGQHAVRVAAAMGAKVYIAGLDEQNFNKIQESIAGNLQFIQSTPENIGSCVIDADVVIGAVLCRGAKAPKVLTEEMVKSMQSGSVVVDVSIDQGGCFETSRPTTHSDPVFVVHGVVHYCVTNMPGAYPRTSTIALADATIGYVEKIASQPMSVWLEDRGLAKAVNTYQGDLTYEQVAHDLDLYEKYKKL